MTIKNTRGRFRLLISHEDIVIIALTIVFAILLIGNAIYLSQFSVFMTLISAFGALLFLLNAFQRGQRAEKVHCFASLFAFLSYVYLAVESLDDSIVWYVTWVSTLLALHHVIDLSIGGVSLWKITRKSMRQ